jgi:peptidyl-tRNA hydrolase
VIQYVLGDFSPPEQELLKKVLDRAVEAIEVWTARGLEVAMNEFNPGSLAPASEETGKRIK